MKVKLLLFGEAVNIPKTSIGLGVGLLSVWVDGEGFTSASNDLGALGYILLETPEVDLGEVSADRQATFSRLHGRVVKVDIKPNMFFRNGGNARIGMTVSTEKDGALVDSTLEFLADDCTGVSVVSNALSFSCTMLQMEKKLAASSENERLLSDDQLETAARDAPAPIDDGRDGDDASLEEQSA